jgi:hypothetical protein
MSDGSHFLKYRRAAKHLDDLEAAFTRWLREGRHTHRLEPDPNASDYLLIKASAEEVPADPFSLLIGDAVHNFRSCLDHLAYALMCAHTTQPSEDMTRESQFPIVGDVNRNGLANQGPTMFQSQRKCIAGISPAAQAIIEELQPYQRATDFQSDPLWKLSVLSNIDKHRIPHLVTSYLHAITFYPFRPKFPFLTIDNARPVSFDLTGARVERDTVIGRIRIERTDSAADEHAVINLTPSVSFADGPLAHDDVIDTLRDIHTFVGGHVLSPLAKFV